MPYPVRLIGGTDRVQTRPPDGPFYGIGERIDDLDDETRISLQRSGARFEAIHDDTPPLPFQAPAPVEIPPDQAALNDEIAATTKPDAKPSAGKKGDA